MMLSLQAQELHQCSHQPWRPALCVLHPCHILIPGVKLNGNVPLLFSPPALRRSLRVQHCCQGCMCLWVAPQVKLQFIQLSQGTAGVTLLRRQHRSTQQNRDPSATLHLAPAVAASRTRGTAVPPVKAHSTVRLIVSVSPGRSPVHNCLLPAASKNDTRHLCNAHTHNVAAVFSNNCSTRLC